MATLQNFVDGRYVDAHGTATIDVVSPVTEQVVAVSPVSDAADVDTAWYGTAVRALDSSDSRAAAAAERAMLATLEAGDLVLDDAMDFDLAAERFCQAREEVRLLDGLLDASAGLPVAA